MTENERAELVIAGLNKQLTEQFALSTKYVGIAERLRAALEIIAGDRRALDNLMGNADIARAALNSVDQLPLLRDMDQQPPRTEK